MNILEQNTKIFSFAFTFTMAKSIKPSKTSPAKAKANKSKVSRPSSINGKSSADRIMDAIASRHSLGDTKPDRQIIMGLAAITSKGSYGTTLLNMKKKLGWVEYDKTSVWFTPAGQEHVGPDAIQVPQNNDAMQAKIRQDMIKVAKSREIFDLMLDGAAYSKEELAEMMNLPVNKSFGTYTSGLSKVSEKVGKKMRLIDLCFPTGRPCDAGN